MNYDISQIEKFMKLNIRISNLKISKNLELFFVLILIVISIIITMIYNVSKTNSEKQYSQLLNNLYFFSSDLPLKFPMKTFLPQVILFDQPTLFK